VKSQECPDWTNHETYLRSNFDQSDNRNFRDGDKRSSRYYRESFDEGSSGRDDDTRKMYNSPKHVVAVDTVEGKLVRQYDKSNNRTSLINDDVRVYKGGSWRDRAYWIDPAQRRYFPQDMATDYIGFRCAVSRVGSKSQKGGKKRN
jgi:gliding motility-associated lipoprotein GldJ